MTADLKQFITNTEAALEFLPEGETIPYDLGIAGMRFEDAEPQEELSAATLNIGDRMIIDSAGYSVKTVYVIKDLRSDYAVLVDEAEEQKGVHVDHWIQFCVPYAAFGIYQGQERLTRLGR